MELQNIKEKNNNFLPNNKYHLFIYFLSIFIAFGVLILYLAIDSFFYFIIIAIIASILEYLLYKYRVRIGALSRPEREYFAERKRIIYEEEKRKKAKVYKL